MIVNKQLTLDGIGMPVVDARGGQNVITLSAEGIKLEGFTVTGSGGDFLGSCIKVTSNNSTLSGNYVSNKEYAISLFESNNNTLSDNYVSNNEYGISLSSSSNNNTLSGNNVISNNKYGIYLESSSKNNIYNNYFSNANNAKDDGSNIWNITKTSGTNIINGAFFGGNFWSNYAGKDTDRDGLGDTMLPYNSSGRIANGGDYFPFIVTIPFAVNISGIPVKGHVTSNILNVEYTNSSSGEAYNISIFTPNGTRIYYDNGILNGTNPEIIPINWIPSSRGNYTIEAWGRGMIDSTPVYVYDGGEVSPAPEIGTILLVAAGLRD